MRQLKKKSSAGWTASAKLSGANGVNTSQAGECVFFVWQLRRSAPGRLGPRQGLSPLIRNYSDIFAQYTILLPGLTMCYREEDDDDLSGLAQMPPVHSTAH
eukprot:scaffold71428_cov22-Tisochrysis_lutea.AAC.1